MKSPEELHKQLATLKKEIEQRKNQPFYKIFPQEGDYSIYNYPKHLEFIRATKTARQVYFRAANRIGKTLTMAYVAAVWLTGIYPEWWCGRVFNHPTRAWLIGVDHQQLRDALQELLLEKALEPDDGGLLPKDAIIKTTAKQKPAGAVLDIYIKHVSGGTSRVTFKVHEQGRENFQGAKIDFAMFDEEPPIDVYSEVAMRTVSGKKDGEPGTICIGATPLKSFTPFVKMFTPDEGEVLDPSLRCIVATWDDVPHLSEKEKAEMLKGMPPHEIEARTKGIPYLGGGMVFPVSPHRYIVEPFQVNFPRHYKFINGLDTGNTTFAVFGALDHITNTVYIYGEKEFKDVPIPIKAAALSQISKAPYMADTSLNQMAEYDGRNLKQEYTDLGLIIKHPNKKLKEAIIARVYAMMIAGQLKISSDCKQLRQALVSYIRNDDGKIRKQDNPDDHPVDAFLYLIQGLPLAMNEMEIMQEMAMYNSMNAQLYFDNYEEPDNDNRWI